MKDFEYHAPSSLQKVITLQSNLKQNIRIFADVPFVNAFLGEIPFDVSLFGIGGVVEPPLVPLLAASANAVHSATGTRIKELPMTPEAIEY